VNKIVLADGNGNSAAIAPRLGGWLLQYVRQTEAHGPVEVLRYSPKCLNLYPAMPAGSHLMFPVAGYTTSRGKADVYCWNGEERPMPVHGFARRMPWEVDAASDLSLSLVLDADDSTRKLYPFEFRLTLRYELVNGTLRSIVEVENRDHRVMPFSIGFHPYLRTPLAPEGHRDQCAIRLPASREYRMTQAGISTDGRREPHTLSATANAVPARHFGDLAAIKAELIDKISGLCATVEAEFPSPFRCISVWSPEVEAPFYCIEPRTAAADAFTLTGNQLTILEPGRKFSGTMILDLVECQKGAAQAPGADH
jgi:galactose mutarotase-like enzyme